MMIDQNALKAAVAEAALDHVVKGEILGVGTGSTTRLFIDALAKIKHTFPGAVASSEDTRKRLEGHGIKVFDLNDVTNIAVYIDGADEITPEMHMIKGGGAALTREKIVTAVSEKFVCIVDESKVVDVLGKFPLPVEVIPSARAYVMRELTKFGGTPVLREGVITDNGNVIVDVKGLKIIDPVDMETRLNQIAGVVCNGLFACKPANVCLIGSAAGVKCLTLDNFKSL